MTDEEIRMALSLLLKSIEDLAVERGVYRNLVLTVPSLKAQVADLMKSPQVDLAREKYRRLRSEIQEALQSQDSHGLFERLGAAKVLLD